MFCGGFSWIVIVVFLVVDFAAISRNLLFRVLFLLVIFSDVFFSVFVWGVFVGGGLCLGVIYYYWNHYVLIRSVSKGFIGFGLE